MIKIWMPTNKITTMDERGMTLVEVIAVIVLITLISLVVGRSVFSASSGAKAKLNLTKMENLRQALGQYRLQYNVYPSKLEDLVKASPEVKASGQLFTPLATEEDLKDIWGIDYLYTADKGGRTYLLKCLGADGAEGGEGENQDITKQP
jgi:general secretion pathway protein G